MILYIMFNDPLYYSQNHMAMCWLRERITQTSEHELGRRCDGRGQKNGGDQTDGVRLKDLTLSSR